MARPRAFCALPIVLIFALLGALRAHAQSESASPASPAIHLEAMPTKRICATLTLDAQIPELDAREWIVLAPKPVPLSGQSDLQSSLSVNGQLIASPDACEQSALHRSILCAHIFSDAETGRHSLSVQTVYLATLSARRLVAGPSPLPIPTLPLGDRRLLTASTQTTDWGTPDFQAWLTRRDLRREQNEPDLDLARRAFQTVRSNYSYFYDPDQDRRASVICRLSRADCGGLSNLFIAVLRANGIPARLLIGRWAHSAGPDNRCRQMHVKSEFYLPDVGWVPVEMSGAVSDKAASLETYFGRDTGDFLTLSVNADFIFETNGWGQKHLLALQGPCYWGIGLGTFAGCTESITWCVTTEAISSGDVSGASHLVVSASSR